MVFFCDAYFLGFALFLLVFGWLVVFSFCFVILVVLLDAGLLDL